MLVLTRKKHEKIILTVGDIEIIICAVEIKGNRVRIGVKAPKSVDIRREELLKDARSDVARSDVARSDVARSDVARSDVVATKNKETKCLKP